MFILLVTQVSLFLKTTKTPFDRLLIATNFYEKIPIISIDENFPLYKNIIEIIW